MFNQIAFIYLQIKQLKHTYTHTTNKTQQEMILHAHELDN